MRHFESAIVKTPFPFQAAYSDKSNICFDYHSLSGIVGQSGHNRQRQGKVVLHVIAGEKVYYLSIYFNVFRTQRQNRPKRYVNGPYLTPLS